MGHVMRCLAVSEMLEDAFELSFVMFQPDQGVKEVVSKAGLPVVELSSLLDTDYARPADAVVLDGYWFDTDYVKKIKSLNKKVIQIDDFAGPDFFSDLVINHAIGADYSGSVIHQGGSLLSGSSYALLRKEFLLAAQTPAKPRALDSLLLSMGGADPKNYTLQLLEAIQHLPQKFKSITVIAGGANLHKSALEAFIARAPQLNVQVKESLQAREIITLLQNTSLFICSASTIAYEAMAVKVPLACFMTADNQEKIYNGLLEANAALGLGDISRLDSAGLAAALAAAFADSDKAELCMSSQRQLIDGRSGERIKEKILALWN
jgi:UDP-2,4-diacetamido-2,4,6-trideoxy-beta-L-altropyranose hydrolase